MSGTFSIRFERCVSFIMAFQRFLKVLWNIIIFQEYLILYQRMPMGLNISPSYITKDFLINRINF